MQEVLPGEVGHHGWDGDDDGAWLASLPLSLCEWAAADRLACALAEAGSVLRPGAEQGR